MKKIIVSLSLLFFISGCKSSTDVKTLFTGDLRGAKVAIDTSSVSKGKKVFNTYCIACHQKDGLGKAGVGPRINSPEFLGLADNAFIKKTILVGRTGTSMMAFSAIPDVSKEIDHLVSYIRSWQNDYDTFKAYKLDNARIIKGNPTKGKALYVNYCASCHGAKGNGYMSGGSGPAIGLKGFLDVASDEYIKKTIELGRAGTAMKSFSKSKGLANLSEENIDDIVTFLRRSRS